MRYYLLALTSGLLLILSQPKVGLFPLAFVGLVPVLLAVVRDPSLSFRLGFLTGWSYFMGLLYWLLGVMTHFGGLPLPAALGVLALLSAYLGLYFGIGLYFFVRLRCYRATLCGAVSFAAVMVLLDYLRAYLLGGFPWGFLGAAVYRFLDFIQVADLGGVYLVSFFLFLANYGLFALWLEGLKAWRVGLFVLVCLGLVLVYGHHQRARLWPAKTFRAGLIQGNIPQDVKWDAAFQRETLARYFRLSERALSAGGDLLVWPETAVPFYFFVDQGLGPQILSWTKKHQATLLFGAPRLGLLHGRVAVFNSLFLVDKGRVLGVYDKQHLVPFGEYIPLGDVFPFLRTFAVASGDYRRGLQGRPLVLAPGKIFGPLICFESVFPRLARKRVRQGATVLVVVTNDAWFGRSAGPYQHFAAAALRAVETRRYVLRAANTGISGVIAPTGEVLYATRLEQTAAPCVSAGFLSYLTVYTRYGAYFPGLYLFLALPALFKSLFRRRPW